MMSLMVNIWFNVPYHGVLWFVCWSQKSPNDLRNVTLS